jgi:hypothetical protein
MQGELSNNMSNIWHMLNIDSLTIDAGFGLEYYLLDNIDKAKPLLSKGIQFCDMIQKGNLAITQEVINYSDLDAWEDIQILVKSKSPDELKTIIEEAALVKIDLMKMVQEDETYAKEKIRKMQDFFIETGKPYLSRAYNLMRRRERCRRL